YFLILTIFAARSLISCKAALISSGRAENRLNSLSLPLSVERNGKKEYNAQTSLGPPLRQGTSNEYSHPLF
ncbi:MAG: hypothetical protein IJM56_00670, partial [Clostridia bacterium]|nr:hypothetical protein [Clostridia bacterium]